MWKRGSGRTAQQMKDAPRDAVFIWCQPKSVGYAVSLAKHLGRDDLEIVHEGWLSSRQYHGRRLPGLVVDHAYPHPRSERIEEAQAHVAKESR